MSMTWLFDKAKGSSHSEWKMLSCHVQLQNHHTSLALIREETSILKCAKEGCLIATAKSYESRPMETFVELFCAWIREKRFLLTGKRDFEADVKIHPYS